MNSYIHDNTAANRGGGVFGDSRNWIINCTITGNAAEEGAGVYNDDPELIPQATYNYGWIRNSIIWNNNGNDFYCDPSGIVEYCFIEDGWPYGDGNKSGDPVFYTEDDYHLTSESPCIDTGRNPYVESVAGWKFILYWRWLNRPFKDIDDENRPFDWQEDATDLYLDLYDMGCDEYVVGMDSRGFKLFPDP